MERAELFVRIPKERIGVLIGPDGSVKREIERRTGTRLLIDSDGGEVTIESAEGGLGSLQALEVVKAVGRGFSPERAFRLFEEDNYLDIIDIRDFVGDSENAMQRMRGRVIGERGKIREMIEQMTGAYISVYGKTVSIIGKPEQIKMARTAVEMLLSGAEHSSVIRFMERERSKRRSMSAAHRAG
jgi:ribosomal RNA assembly protein